MKKFSITFATLCILLIGQLGFASIPEEGPEGPDVAMSETDAANFFMLDTEDYALPATAQIPSMMPCEGIVSSTFGWRKLSRRGAGRMHKGMDFAAAMGTPVHATADGTVDFVGYKGGYGLTVMIDHGGDLSTLYAHNSKVLVTPGQKVTRGQQLSLSGSSGHSTGPHLHYEVRVSGNPVNPSRFL